jgi:hypothetical protein
MRCVQRGLRGPVVFTVLLGFLLPVTALAAEPPGIGLGVNVNVPGVGNTGVNVNVGGNGGVNVNANVGGGSVASGNANATAGGGGPVVSGNANVSVGNGGSVASGNANATVGGGNGNVASGNANANVGGGSVAATDNRANVGNAGGSSNPGNNDHREVIGVQTNTSVGNGPNGSVATVNGCVEVGANCTTPSTSATVGGSPAIGVNACVVVDGKCTTPPTTITTGGTPLVGANACVVVDGKCTVQPTNDPPTIGANACVIVDGACTTQPSATPSTVGVNGCVAVVGTCDGATTPGGTGIGIGGGGTTPVGGVGLCVVVLDTCTGTVGGGTTPGGGTTTIGTANGGTGGNGGGLTITATADGSAFANGAGVQQNAAADDNPAVCTIPLISFSKDATMSSAIVDCATVHVSGARANLPAGFGPMEDNSTAGASTRQLGTSGRVMTDVIGSCTGCETAYGSGTGYRSFVQLKDATSGDFINVGLIHDAAATGDSPTALTLAIETGRKTATGYDVSRGYVNTTTNRVPDGRATILLAWTPQGVTVSVNGIILPNENAPRAASVGTYSVRMNQPVVSFAAGAKNPGERVDTTFKSIAFG